MVDVTNSDGLRIERLEAENARLRAALAAEQAQAEPVARGDWEGAEEWMPLAWHLCAEENGEESCNELVWEGGPIPEPWGERWLKYEDEAKRMIALVREHTAPQPAPAERAPLIDSPTLTARWQEFGRTQACRDAIKWAQEGEIPGALFTAFRAGMQWQCGPQASAWMPQASAFAAPAERKPLTYEQAAEAWRAWEQQPAPDHWWDVAEEHRRKAAYIAGLQDGERAHSIGVRLEGQS